MGNNGLFIVALLVVIIVLAVVFGRRVIPNPTVVQPVVTVTGTVTPTPITSLTPAVTIVPLSTLPATFNQTSPATTGMVRKFTIAASNYQFTPNQITVNHGDTVQITLNGAGGPHGFAIDEFNVQSQLVSDGQNDTISFVADKPGTYQFYCPVDSHRQMGMVGTLTVR
ncbi:cupredoxin domain-containing protein [Patescibacteria group bacterium]|nr:cupredoxin domain-containing protein [Patescibacteria group bacterium]